MDSYYNQKDLFFISQKSNSYYNQKDLFFIGRKKSAV